MITLQMFGQYLMELFKVIALNYKFYQFVILQSKATSKIETRVKSQYCLSFIDFTKR